MATPEEITQQFQYAFNAKEDIKDAINEKGVEVTDDTPFGEYGNRVRQITTDTSPFAYSSGTDSAVLKSTDPLEANTASGSHAVAVGSQNEASGDNSFTAGNNLEATANNQTVVGKFNTTNNNALFIVGNGTDAQNKSNAFEVKEDGTASIATAPSATMDVANKGYVDNGLAGKADSSNTYTKTEVDNALSAKANASDVYTKQQTYSQTEVNELLVDKADKSTTYTKTETDTLLSSKANSADVYTKTETDTLLSGKADTSTTYTKTETDTLLSSKANSADVYTKTQTDDLLDEKANVSGYYKEMAVGYAEQLLSTTGVETSDSFITRTTAGSADVASGPVRIKKIKGNTINWNQICVNGNFAGTTGWRVNSPTAITSFTTLDNVATLEAASSGSIYAQLQYAIVGHKYAMRYTIRSSVDNVRVGTNYGEGASSGIVSYFTIGTNWTICSRLLEATSTARYFYVYVSTAGTYNVKNAMLFDLTQMFGAGNEPTLDEFNAMYNDNYYSYNAGELVSCKPSDMQTVGFNLCSCASIFEKTFTTYANTITGDDLTAVKNWLKSLQRYYQPLIWEIDNSGYTTDTPSDTMPVGALYCRNSSTNPVIVIRPGEEFSLNSIDIDSISQIYFYGRTQQPITFSNACMHFVWSGSRNGDHEPYKQNTLAIDTATYFPNGMRSAPSAYDEINFETHKAITRCGMHAYQSGDESDPDVITDGTNTVYALTTPTEVSIPESTANIYPADDWGTETWLQTDNPNPAAPVGSELFYYANLRDKLQHQPDLPEAGDGNYITRVTGTQMSLIPGYSKDEIDALLAEPEPEPDTSITVTSPQGLLKIASLVAAGNTFAGQTIVLENDVDMTGLNFDGLGDSTYPFSGSLDGQGHTVTLDQTYTGEQRDIGGLIRFLAIPNGTTVTIQNVKVAGTITITPSAGDKADTHGGLITNTRSGVTGTGACGLNIFNCQSSVYFQINSARVGQVAGFIAWVGHQDGYFAPMTINIDSCVWDGTINAGAATADAAGFIANTGLNKTGRNVVINIKNSVADGKIALNVAWSDNTALFIGNQKCNHTNATGTTTVNVENVICMAIMTSSVTLNSGNWFSYFNRQDTVYGILNLTNFYYRTFNCGGFNPIPLTPANGGAPTTQTNVVVKTLSDMATLYGTDFSDQSKWSYYNTYSATGTDVIAPIPRSLYKTFH